MMVDERADFAIVDEALEQRTPTLVGLEPHTGARGASASQQRLGSDDLHRCNSHESAPSGEVRAPRTDDFVPTRRCAIARGIECLAPLTLLIEEHLFL